MSERIVDYLVIGNSAAGVTAAEQIRANDAQGSVLIVGREPYAVYGRPLISYLIAGKTTRERLGWKDSGFYDRIGIECLVGPDAEVVSLDPEAHTATLADGSVVTYGKCLLATGSIPFTPPIKGLDGRENVHTFFTLDDAEGVWEDARRARQEADAEGRSARAVVIGSGMIGLKAAEAIAGYVDEVCVFELADRILPAALDAQGSELLQRLLDRHGIMCRPGLSVQEACGDGRRATSVILTNGERTPCDFIVAAVGARPNSKLAVDAGAQQGRGLVCGPDLQTSLPDVYAAGDLVQVTDVLTGDERPLALWPNAVEQGACAGRYMAGAPDAEPFDGAFAVNAVDFFETSLLTAGVINPPEGAGYETLARQERDSYVKFVMKDGRLCGYILLNRPDNAGVYTALIKDKTELSAFPEEAFLDMPLENLDFSRDDRWKRLHAFYPSCLDDRGWKETR
ncbi:MAG TPA: NAD(P)/FAD-dependent oxidoreductase [Candidatus Aveggerthella stercoripullorum]|uniref:NAD(P)/FAD-dependent oxidoreductase n=1 Tax=Candidatus Aveggerthella stercoripullorum TaxID=2840688 RepID=A0A9D1D545_9ACTN|nr:NAD(P)/FAD-dependent oxidoreductase [Candidatus Aveggerthella stercoripullorum]